MAVGTLAEQIATQLPGGERGVLPPWVDDLRRRGTESFRRNGFPGLRLEAWKYTPLKHFERGLQGLGRPAEESGAAPFPELGLDAQFEVRLVDGRIASGRGELHEGLEVLELGDALASGDEFLREFLSALDTEHADHAFAALNTADLAEGLVIRVRRNTDVGRLALYWSGGEEAAGRLFNSRVCVLLDPGSRLELVEHYGGAVSSALNVVLQARVAGGAYLDHGRLQELPADASLITRTEVTQAGASQYDYFGLDLCGGLVRHDVRVQLQGRGGQCALNGAYLLGGRSHVDNHLEVEHQERDCTSAQFFRGVLSDRARAVFNGRVHVHPGADGTEARQSNANLLLSPHAEVDTKPELQIEADEVIASHGATVGQLDEQAVFYLRSRGLDEAEARAVLTGAFCKAAMHRMSEGPVREAFSRELARHLEEGQA